MLIFTSRDDLDAGFERAHTLVSELEKRNVQVRLIHKLGFNLDDLHMVARHKIVSTPTVLIMKDDKPVYRKLGLPSASTLLELNKKLE